MQGLGKAGRVNFGGGMEMGLNVPAGRASKSQAGCGAVASVGFPAWLSAQGSGPSGLTQPKIFFQLYFVVISLIIKPLLPKPNFATLFNLF